MKKSLSQAIALATLVGATAAHAVDVNPDGIGGALVYPLYTVNEGNTSLVSVVNTTGAYKAVKVRFVEAKNSAEVLDFHLYLSPYDKWSGTIVPTADGAKLVSNDRSCIAGISANDGTFPKAGLPFRTEQITLDEQRLRTHAPTHMSTAAEKAARVRVGHFEAIEMGEVDGGIVPSSVTAAFPAGRTLQSGILHTNGVPGGCDLVTNWWKTDLGMSGTGLDRVNKLQKTGGVGAAITAPKGGLYGTGGIVNVAAGWAASYDAVALINDLTAYRAATAGTEFYTAPQHPRPGSIYPHLGTVTTLGKMLGADTTAQPYAEGATPKTSNGLTAGTAFVVPSDSRLNEVTKALEVAAIYNDYYVDPALDAGTELVVTFPTKRFYTFEAQDADSSLKYIYTAGRYDFGTYAGNGGPTLGAPTAHAEGAGWAQTVAALKAVNAGAVAPEDGAAHAASVFETRWSSETKTATVGFKSPTLFGSDEESVTATDGFISPRPLVAGTIPLNYEANVISLNNSDALGAAELVGVNVETPFMEGWLAIEREANAVVPAVGFGIITTKNGVSADGALRNFAQTFKHKTE